MKSDPENLSQMVDKVKKWLLASRWKKAQWCALSVIKLDKKIEYRRRCHINIQKNVRMYLAKKQHRPRYLGIAKINNLQSIIARMEGVASQLRKDKDSSMNEVKRLQMEMKEAIFKIKANSKIRPDEINTLHSNLMNKANKEMAGLQRKLEEQKNSEEKERLRRIQEEMETEKKRKQEEEWKKQQEEENKRIKIEMEQRRKVEEAEVMKIEESEMTKIEQIQIEKECKEEAQRREQLEQERRDHELALRLAQECNSFVDDIIPNSQRLSGVRMSNSTSNNKLNRPEQIRTLQALNNNSKYDLSKWKYSELRDTINTSCDIDLLEACRVEFHRRLKIYHAWKAKNRRRSVMDENERAPRSIMDAAAKSPRTPTKNVISGSSQRYFRIPFIRPNGLTNGHSDSLNESNNKRGWWYAHFDGQYVARQMELHPDKPAILLTAGVDDMQMCELSLEETGLTRKRGAEILEHEFNKEWEKHGGRPYIRNVDRAK